MWSNLKMIKWIVGSVVAMAIILWCAGVRAQVTTYLGPTGTYMGQSIANGNITTFTGPQGQYVGQVIAPYPSPTQPLPPAYWGPNGR